MNLQDIKNLNRELDAINSQLSNINYRLIGPVPEASCASPDRIKSDSIIEAIETLAGLVSKINNEITILDNAVGGEARTFPSEGNPSIDLSKISWGKR